MEDLRRLHDTADAIAAVVLADHPQQLPAAADRALLPSDEGSPGLQRPSFLAGQGDENATEQLGVQGDHRRLAFGMEIRKRQRNLRKVHRGEPVCDPLWIVRGGHHLCVGIEPPHIVAVLGRQVR